MRRTMIEPAHGVKRVLSPLSHKSYETATHPRKMRCRPLQTVRGEAPATRRPIRAF